MKLTKMSFGLFCAFASLVGTVTAAVSPNDCAGDSDSARIEAAIAAATGSEGSREVVIPAHNVRTGGDVWLIDRAILLPSDFTLTLSNAVVRLAPGVQDNIVRNAGTANPDAPTGNSHITLRGIGKSILSGGTGESHFTPAGDQSGWRTIGVLYYDVQYFTIENLTLENTQAWAISMENGCAYGTVRHIHYELSNSIPNQDGVDVRKGCHDITIDTLTGTTGDDSVAITGLLDAATPAETPAYTMQLGDRFWTGDNDIYNITIRNVFTTCLGGHGVVRLLNHDGIKLHDVVIENVIEPVGGTVSMRGVMIGDTNYSTVSTNKLGETYNVYVTNVQSYASNVIQIGGTLKDADFQGITSLGTGSAISYGTMATQNITFSESTEPMRGLPTELEDAVLEVEVNADGTCDCLTASGDLILTGDCRVELTLGSGSFVTPAANRYVVAKWNGRCEGLFTLDAATAGDWCLMKDEANSCFRLVKPESTQALSIDEGGTRIFTGVTGYTVADPSVVEVVDDGDGTLQLRAKSRGTTTVTVCTATGCVKYTVTTSSALYWATQTVTADPSGENYGLVAVTPVSRTADELERLDAWSDAAASHAQDTASAGAPQTFHIYARPRGDNVFVGWQTAAQRTAGTWTAQALDADGIARTSLVHNASSTLGQANSSQDALYALFKQVVDGGAVQLYTATSKTYSNVIGFEIDRSSVLSGSLSGSKLTVTGASSGTATLTVYTATTRVTYAVTVVDAYRAKATAGVANDSTSRGTVLVTLTKGASGTYAATSSKTREEGGTAPSTFKFWAYASPNAGYGFLGWSDQPGAIAYSGTSPKELSVTSSKTSVPEVKTYAHFGPLFTVTAASEDANKGTVAATASSPAASGLTVTQIQPLTATATFTATPKSGYIFYRWVIVRNDETIYDGANPLTKTYDATTTVTAQFKQYTDAGNLYVECGKTVSPSTEFTNVQNVFVDKPELATAVMDNMTLKVTADGWYGANHSTNVSVKVDTGLSLTVYNVIVSKPYHEHAFSVGIDGETGCEHPDHKFPLEKEVVYTADVPGIADVFQRGERVIVRGTDRGTKVVDIDAYYFGAQYTITVSKPYRDVTITRSIDTTMLPVSASDDTMRTFTNIASVVSADSSKVTARQVGDNVEITTLANGSTVVTVDCHAETWRYTVNVSLASVTETFKIPVGKSVSSAFAEITSISQNDASKAIVGVEQNGTTVTMTGLKVGSTGFTVVGKVTAGGGYVNKTMDVQVYDDSNGSISYDEAQLSYNGAQRVEKLSGGDLLYVFKNPNVSAYFDIPDGYVARARILAVGGGGAGGTQSKRGNGGGGGGAGGFVEQADVTLKGGRYYVAVGKGGRKADAKLNPVAGNNGSNSVITNALGVAYANAMGGGGGGASMLGNSDGIYGGSGGGAAWYGSVAGVGGQGYHTQGSDGAVPTVINNGGGGGGAGAVGSESTGGAGRASDITGESVVYATGGAGGLADGVGGGADGTNGLGDGGAGGNGDFGGSGGDGVVVVRLASVKKYQKVAIPTDGDGYFTSRFVFEENTTVTAFNRSKFEADHPGALAYVDGVISTNCTKVTSGGSSVLRGVGYYSFVLYLNDGFTWNDGTTYGTTAGQLLNWRVVLSSGAVDATVAVNKTVEWDGPDDATITITSHSTPEMNPVAPKVLFLGGLCGAHSLTRDTLIQTLNKVAEKADMDYYLFPDHLAHPGTAWSAYAQKDVASSLKMGSTLSAAQLDAIHDFSTTSDLDSDNHCVWASFVTTITNVLKSTYPTKYDYVIMEFDGNRLVHNLPITNKVHMAAATKAAEILKPLYAQKKIMWIVDSKNTFQSNNDPFISNYYVPSTWSEISGNKQDVNNEKYALLLCLLDPKAILEASNSRYDGKGYDFSTTGDFYKRTGIARFGYVAMETTYNKYVRNDPNPNTTYYGNVAQLLKDIESTIKVVAYNISGYDQVKANVGLTVTSITVDLALETGKEDVKDVPASAWKEVLRWTPTGGSEITAEGKYLNITQNIKFDPTTNEVEYNLTNIVVEAWTKLAIHVHDDGTFKSSVGAVQNPVTGKWEKNPNYGAAQVAFVDEGGNETEVKGSAETIIPLTFTARTLSGEAVNGEIFLNGMTNNPVSFSDGYSPTVSYRGNAGYWLSELYIDGHAQTINETNMVYVLFRNIDQDHHVKAVYESVVGSITATPVTKVYDRKISVPTVTLGDDWKVENPEENVKILYAWSADAADSEWKTAEQWAATANPTDAQAGVGVKKMYYRVMVNQPGWGEEGSIDSWGWKIVGSGSSTVTINKAELTIVANGQSISKGAAIPQNGGVTIHGLVDGDTEANALKGTYTYTSQDYTPATSPVGLYHLMPGGKTATNYEVTYVEGLLAVGSAPIYVNGVPQASFLKPEATGVEPVTKVYDGNSYGLIATVTQPTPGITETWSSDDAKTWSETRPTFKNVGTYKVWYKVFDPAGNYITASNYQYVTILPREVTLTSASATKMFDGEALVKNVVTLTAGALVNGETFSYNTISRITEVGTLDNDFRYSFSSDVEGNSNYAVTKVLGLLAVTPAKINVNGVLQPDNPEPKQRLDQQSNGVDPVVAPYSGEGTNLVIHVIKPETGAHIRYTTTPDDPTSWTENLLFTNLCDIAVWYSIEDPAGNYAPVTNFQFVTIVPRPVTVTAGSATKVYDGTPLTCTAIAKVENMVPGDTLVAMTPTAESRQTDVGTGANEIASVTPGPNTDLANYSFTYLPGELTVTKRPVTLRSPTKTSVYQSGQSFTFLASEIEADGIVEGEAFNYSNFAKISGAVGSTKATFDVADGSAKLANYDITYDYGTLILGDATMYIGGVKQDPGLDPENPAIDTGVDPVDVVYDGASHPLEVVVTYPDDDIAEKTILFSLDGTTWKPLDQFDFTNKRDKTKVWYSVEAPNFTSVTNYSYVTISPRAATVTAASATKVYDGTALKTSAFTNDGFVSGQGAQAVTMTSASTRTDAGMADNEISKVTSWKSGTTSSNYTITYVKGKLTVTPAPTHPSYPEIYRTYDGSTDTFVVTVPSSEIEEPTVRYSTDGGQTWSTTPPTFTNAGEYPVLSIVEDPSGNHAAVTNETTVTILHREITVKVNPAQMRYGEAEPTYTATVTCNDNGEALIETELPKISYKIGPTGTLKVGQNTLHASGEEYQDNYHITYIDNILTIYDKKTIPYEVTNLEVVYDGNRRCISVAVTDPSVPKPTIKFATSEYGEYVTDLGTLAPRDISQDGGTPIWFTITSSDSSYQPVKSVGILKILPRPVTVTADDKSKKIGEADPEFTATVSNLASGDDAGVISYTLSRASGETEGTYVITPAGDEAQGNYTVTYKTGTLTISKKIIAIDNKPQDPTQPGGLPTPDKPGSTTDNGTGVKNIYKTYDGKTTNIIVKVTAPSASEATVQYAALAPNATPTGSTSWSETVPTQLNAGTNKVYYIVSATDYQTITNYAWVVIDPCPATVTADNKTKEYGQADPALTVTVTGLVGSDTVTNAISRAPGETYGDYAITPTGDARQGNYAVKYVAGKLTITHEGVKSLWICDHEDAGANKIYLAFKLERTQGEVTAEFVKRLDADNRIQVVCGAVEADLAKAEPTLVHLRDAKALPDLDKGWIWVTIDVSGHLDASACLWKILIAE